MSDTPTQRLPGAGAPAPDDERRKTRTLLAILIGLAGALLLAVIALVVVLLLNSGGSAAPGETPSATPTESESPTPEPTPSDTPSATPSQTPSQAPSATAAPPPPPPPDDSPGFTSLTYTQTVMCNTSFPPGYTPPKVSFSYTTKNAVAVWFMLGEGDAAAAGAFPMPLSGTHNDVYGSGPLEYPCPEASQKYTLTLIGSNGQKVHRTFTVVNNGDKS